MEKEDLEAEPVPEARFGPPAGRRGAGAELRRLAQGAGRDASTARGGCELFRSPSLDALSQPGETERDFRIRLGDLARERRDAQVEALRRKHGPKVAQLEDRIRRAEQAKEKQAEQARSQTWSTVISAGTAVLGALFGGGRRRGSAFSKAGTAARGFGRTLQERQDVARAEENLV